jgi:hypothetical protein
VGFAIPGANGTLFGRAAGSGSAADGAARVSRRTPNGAAEASRLPHSLRAPVDDALGATSRDVSASPLSVDDNRRRPFAATPLRNSIRFLRALHPRGSPPSPLASTLPTRRRRPEPPPRRRRIVIIDAPSPLNSDRAQHRVGPMAVVRHMTPSCSIVAREAGRNPQHRGGGLFFGEVDVKKVDREAKPPVVTISVTPGEGRGSRSQYRRNGTQKGPARSLRRQGARRLGSADRTSSGRPLGARQRNARSRRCAQARLPPRRSSGAKLTSTQTRTRPRCRSSSTADRRSVSATSRSTAS